MTDCRLCQDDLKAYADRELAWPRRLAVRRHLSGCAACRKELTAMQTITDDLRAAESTETLDPALRAKLLAAPPAPNSGGARGKVGPSPMSPELGARGRPARSPLTFVLQLAGAAAIILVLAALLFPIFGKAREKARQVSPQSEARELALERMQQEQDHNEPSSATPPAPAMSASPAVPIETLTRQVHKVATLGVEVDDAEAKSDQVAQLVKAAGGFVADNTLTTNGDGTKSAELTVKVPVVQFETTLGQVAKLGDVTAKNITGEDITGQISDSDQSEGVLEDESRRADAHLKTLGKKAGWRDQQAAQDARIQLAQARARLQMLKHMAALSTLSISLTEKAKPAAPPPVANGFLSGLSDTTHAATGSLLASAGVLFSLVIWLLAYAPLWLPLALIGRYAYRRYHVV